MKKGLRKNGRLHAEDEELDEYACRAFNPDDHICVVLPSGAYATVAPDCPPETLAALDRMAVLAVAQLMQGDGA